MKPTYIDILNNVNKPPVWYDENGAPRYEPFRPEITSNPSSSEIMLIEIKCQECGRKFIVECTHSRYHFLIKRPVTVPIKLFSEELANNPKYLPSYGDPPFHSKYDDSNSCHAGSTMTSISIRIIELWKYNEKSYKWEKMQNVG
jgi:hypothetical protein